MRKFLLVVLGVVAVLLLAGGAAIAWLAARVDEDQLRAILAQRLADALGREVTIAGHLDLRLGLSPSISVRGVAVANASWGTAPRMLELGQVDATLELLPLLAKRVSVGELKLRDVRAWLETDAAGRGNWELGGAGGGALPWFYLVEAERVRIALREGATGTTRELAVERASAAVDRRDGLVSLTLVGALDGDKLEMSGTVGPLAALLEDGSSASLDVSARMHGIRLTAKGSLVEPRALRGLAVTLNLAADDTAGLAKLLGRPLPPLGAWRAGGRLEDRTGKLALRGLALAAGQRETILLNMKGGIEDLLAVGAPRGVRLDVLLEGADTVALGQALGVALPPLGPFQGTARIEDRNGVLALPALDVAVGTRDQATILVRGSIGDPLAVAGPGGIALNATVDGNSTDMLAPLLGMPVPRVGAFRVSAHLAGSVRELSFGGLAAAIGASDLQGEGKIVLGGARPRLEARLDSKRLDLEEWQRPSAAAPRRQGRVFDATPIPLDWAGLVDLALQLKAEELRVADQRLAEVTLQLGLADRVLTLQPSAAQLYGGNARLEGGLDARGVAPALRLKLQARGLDAGAIARRAGSTEKLEGRLDVTLDLTGQGSSPRALAGSLNGKAAATMTQGRIGHRHLELLAADLTRVLLPGGGESDTAIPCAVAQFDIRGGLATAQALLLDTKRVTVTGSGTVNLGSEALALRLDPKPKEASLLSLAHPLLVGGTLMAPTVRPDPVGVAKGLGGAALGLAMGPIGLLIPFVSGGTGEANPCAKLLGGR